MPLRDIRKDFIDRSGRFDLVKTEGADDYVDNGALTYIQKGHRMLERRLVFARPSGVFQTSIAIGQSFAIIPHPIIIRKVFFDKQPLRRQDYSTVLPCVAEGASGIPKFYAICAPKNPLVNSNYLELPAVELFSQTKGSVEDSIFIYPYPEIAGTVHVFGVFADPSLLLDTDENVYTERFADLLVLCCLYQVELLFRNISGAQSWLQAIEVEISEIRKNNTEEIWGEGNANI